jgi:hypothetical protein
VDSTTQESRFERRKRYQDHHDRMREIAQVLDLALSSSRLLICHTKQQVLSGAKQILRDVERAERAYGEELYANRG